MLEFLFLFLETNLLLFFKTFSIGTGRHRRFAPIHSQKCEEEEEEEEESIE